MPSKSVTSVLAEKTSCFDLVTVPPDAKEVAKQCLLDWLGVSLAARLDPLVEMLTEVAVEDSGALDCTLLGRGARASLSQAVLINGAMGHALDYDDVIISMGHPTVPVAPVAFALAEQRGLAGRALLEAFVAGVEAEVRVARLLGRSHYARGWHGTATYGTFGAVAAASRLLGLNAAATAQAFGIAGTQAAGLKAVFGTMCKPLHAGKAAQNGLLAARLAARGFTSNPDILDADQGFGATQSDRLDPDAALAEPPGGAWVRQTLFKYHAACYLTHSSINAADALRREHGFAADDVRSVKVGVDPGHLKVCAIPEPASGLECKFSLTQTVAMALTGENTADEGLYTDAVANRPDLLALRRKVTVAPRAGPTSTLSDVVVTLADNRTLRGEADVAVPAADVAAQGELLRAKFLVLAGPVLGEGRASELADRVLALEGEDDLRPLIALAA